MLNPWETEEGKVIWKSPSEYFTWLRGALRQIWADYPLRKEWKKRQLRPVTSEEKATKVFHTSTKNVGQCVYCKEFMAGSKLEVDHKTPSNGCTNKEEATDFLWYCAGLIGDMFQLACNPCHKIKTYAERYGMSFEDAIVEKEVIAICKDTSNTKKFLEDNNVLPGKNADIRRTQVREVISKRYDKS